MAIIFSQSISLTDLLPAYNNNVVEFSSDAIPVGETIVKGTILIDGITFEVQAISNVVKFNFRDVIKVLMDNQFDDDVVYNSDCESDNSLRDLYGITYTVTFSDNTTENVLKYIYFYKGIVQINDSVNIDINDDFTLSRSSLTIFKGFPSDVVIATSGYIGIKNNNNGNENVVTYTAGNDKVGRVLFLTDKYVFQKRVETDGGTFTENQCWRDRFGLRMLDLGYNSLTFVDNIAINKTIRLLDQCEGTYLKWFNEEGSWSYWLFSSIHKTNVKTKTLATYNTDFLSIGSTFDTSLITGKTAVETRKLTAEQLTEDEVLQVKDIVTSPRVYMYNGLQNDMTGTWQTVKVKDGNFLTESTKGGINGIRIDIEINKFTQY